MKTSTTSIFLDYDGTQLRPLFNYEKFGLQGDSIVVFRGKMDVCTSHLVDMEDRTNNDYIWSPNALNIIVELFHISIETTVLYQRYLMQTITDLLRKEIDKEFQIRLDGDDIMIQDATSESWKKLSVSIATVSPVSGLIHAGINIDTDVSIPVPAIGLYQLSFTDDKVVALAQSILIGFSEKVDSIKSACTKVRCLV